MYTYLLSNFYWLQNLSSKFFDKKNLASLFFWRISPESGLSSPARTTRRDNPQLREILFSSVSFNGSSNLHCFKKQILNLVPYNSDFMNICLADSTLRSQVSNPLSPNRVSSKCCVSCDSVLCLLHELNANHTKHKQQ